METRTCRYCGNEKDIREFGVAVTTQSKAYRRHKCRDCYRETKGLLKRKKRKQYFDFKRTLSCQRCGNNDYRVLQFHHKDKNKEADVSEIIIRWSWENIRQEMNKCMVLCANCHIIIHAEENNRV